MSVLILGDGDAEEVDLLADAVTDRGAEPVVCDVTDWPGDAPLTYDPADDGATLGERVEYDDLTGAYVFVPKLFRPSELRFHESMRENSRPTLNRVREHRATFESVCYALDDRGVEMLPPVDKYDWHRRKPWQLTLFETEGVPVPDTLFTNSADELVRFYEDHDEVVYKPVTHGGGPKLLTEDDLTDARLDALASSPVQFQEFVPGDDLRVYFLDGEIVAGMRYLSDSYSFKVDVAEGKDVDVESFDPPAEMETAIAAVGERSGLGFGAADVRLRPDGSFALLELNNVPRFAAADLNCGADVAGALADYLIGE